MDEWGTLDKPCPNCGGVLEYWSFSADCRGNSGSSGIKCRTCKKEFTGKDLQEEVEEKERKDNGNK